MFGVWQPKTFAGADLVNEPNSLCWNEVLTRDPEADKAFYPAVFGWTAGKPQFEGAPENYIVWELDGKRGRRHDADDRRVLPGRGPAALERVLRGRRLRRHRRQGPRARARPSSSEPMDMPIGRFANLIDPQGASFTVMQPAVGRLTAAAHLGIRLDDSVVPVVEESGNDEEAPYATTRGQVGDQARPAVRARQEVTEGSRAAPRTAPRRSQPAR